MLFRQFGVSIVFVVLAANVVAASDTTLVCDLKQQGKNKGTPNKVMIEYAKGASEMIVYDSLMATVGKKPIVADVDRDTPQTFVVRWNLIDVPSNQYGDIWVRYTLNWTKKTGRVKISGQLGGIPISYTGFGKCKFDSKARLRDVKPQKDLPGSGVQPYKS